MGDLALTNMALGDNTAAMTLAERAIAMMSIEKDALTGPRPLDILARIAARMGDADRAISTLEKLLSIPYEAPLAANPPLTPALLRLDPMFEPLRKTHAFKTKNLQPVWVKIEFAMLLSHILNLRRSSFRICFERFQQGIAELCCTAIMKFRPAPNNGARSSLHPIHEVDPGNWRAKLVASTGQNSWYRLRQQCSDDSCAI